jgi:DNA-binding response OmpR family regulator
MPSKIVVVVHPDSKARIALRTALESRGLAVATDHSCVDLLEWRSDLHPDLVLVDRSLIDRDGVDLLSEISRKWEETQTVVLPQDLAPASLSSLLAIVDRLLGMRSTRAILAV